LLFEASAQTLLEVAANPRHLGARVGVLSVLHTWGQQLEHHPHVHCVVPGGGLACDPDGAVEQPWRWRSCRPTFFLPVRVLGQVYAADCRRKELTLSGVEFVRRFCLHILPRGLVRIRQYGLLSNRGRGERLARCRALLGMAQGPAEARPSLPGGRPVLGWWLL